MKTKGLVVSVVMWLVAVCAIASEFDGPNMQLGVGGSSTATNVTGFTGMNSNANYDYRNTQGGLNGIFSLGYSQEVPNAYGLNLAASLFYVIGNQKAGDGGKATAWTEGVTQMSESSMSVRKLQNTFGVSFEPGFNFNQETLGYLKLAWVNSRLNMVNTYSLTDPSISVSGAMAEFNQTRTVNGFGYGIGLKKILMNNVFLAVDAMGVAYNTVGFGGNGSIQSQANQVLGFASIGYKF